MTHAQERAIARVCGRECLQRELVDALEHTTSMLLSACLAINDREARRMVLEAVADARAVLAKARGEAA